MRGLAIFNTRRVSKFTQEELLGRYLPSAIRFIGAFDKSGNYALTTRVSQDEAAQAIVDALTHDERLADLTRSHVSVVLVSELVLMTLANQANRKTAGFTRDTLVSHFCEHH